MVFNSLGGGHTHRHFHANDFKKPGTRRQRQTHQTSSTCSILSQSSNKGICRRLFLRTRCRSLAETPRRVETSSICLSFYVRSRTLMKKSTDPNLLLLSYCSTPLHWCTLSPSELLMGRRVTTTVPQVSDQLTPQWNFLPDFRKQDDKFKKEQEMQYNRRHRVQNLPELPDNTSVWVTTNNTNEPGIVVSPAGTPRSYIVETNGGQVRRNQQHLTPMPTKQHPCVTRNSPVQTRSRTGIVVRPSDRLAL